MKKRENYNLEYCETDNCVCVYQTKNNIGRVGIILPNGKIVEGTFINKKFIENNLNQ